MELFAFGCCCFQISKVALLISQAKKCFQALFMQQVCSKWLASSGWGSAFWRSIDPGFVGPNSCRHLGCPDCGWDPCWCCSLVLWDWGSSLSILAAWKSVEFLDHSLPAGWYLARCYSTYCYSSRGMDLSHCFSSAPSAKPFRRSFSMRSVFCHRSWCSSWQSRYWHFQVYPGISVAQTRCKMVDFANSRSCRSCWVAFRP